MIEAGAEQQDEAEVGGGREDEDSDGIENDFTVMTIMTKREVGEEREEEEERRRKRG